MTYSKETYHWKKDHGVCVDCGCNEAVGGTRCPECAAKKSEKAMQKHHGMTPEEKEIHNARRRERAKALRKYRKENGLCARCGKPAYKGHSQCYEHYIYHKRYINNHKQNKGFAELGLCRMCGKEVVDGKKMCADHLKQYQEIMQKNSHTNRRQNETLQQRRILSELPGQVR